jgi:hypothetical protein
MERQIVSGPDLAEADRALRAGCARAGGFVFVSGQLGFDPETGDAGSRTASDRFSRAGATSIVAVPCPSKRHAAREATRWRK